MTPSTRIEPGQEVPQRRIRRASTRPLTPLAGFAVLEALSSNDLDRLEEMIPRHRWNHGSWTPDAVRVDDGLVLIRTGLVALTPAGTADGFMLTDLVDRGECYSTLGGEPGPCAIALRDTVASVLPGPVLRFLIGRAPDIGFALMDALTARAAMLRRTIVSLGRVSVEDRLWARITEFAAHVGVVTPHGTELRLDLTHAQWARVVGGSRESVTLAFGRLERMGLLDRSGRTLLILSADRDEGTAHPGPQDGHPSPHVSPPSGSTTPAPRAWI